MLSGCMPVPAPLAHLLPNTLQIHLANYATHRAYICGCIRTLTLNLTEQVASIPTLLVPLCPCQHFLAPLPLHQATSQSISRPRPPPTQPSHSYAPTIPVHRPYPVVAPRPEPAQPPTDSEFADVVLTYGALMQQWTEHSCTSKVCRIPRPWNGAFPAATCGLFASSRPPLAPKSLLILMQLPSTNHPPRLISPTVKSR